MSSILCGRFTFGRPVDEREQARVGFDLVDLAQKERLGLQLGCAVVQPLVFEILGRERSLSENELVYLVTDSPIWDVSERVIDKYSPDYPEAEPDGPLPERLARLQRFFAGALAVEPITRVLAILTRGYGEDFAEESLPVGRFAEQALRRYEGPLDVPFVKFDLTR